MCLLSPCPNRRWLVNQTLPNGQTSANFISQWNTLDWLLRDGLGHIRHADHLGDGNGTVPMSKDYFDQDSLGRVRGERFETAFAATHTLSVRSTFTNGNPFRADLAYEDSLGLESAQMIYGRPNDYNLTDTDGNERGAGTHGATYKPGPSGTPQITFLPPKVGGADR
jgi:hypothetical protein